MLIVLRKIMLKRKFEMISGTALNAILRTLDFIYRAVGEALKNFKQQWNIIRGGFEKISLTDMNKMDGGKIEGGTNQQFLPIVQANRPYPEQVQPTLGRMAQQYLICFYFIFQCGKERSKTVLRLNNLMNSDITFFFF